MDFSGNNADYASSKPLSRVRSSRVRRHRQPATIRRDPFVASRSQQRRSVSSDSGSFSHHQATKRKSSQEDFKPDSKRRKLPRAARTKLLKDCDHPGASSGEDSDLKSLHALCLNADNSAEASDHEQLCSGGITSRESTTKPDAQLRRADGCSVLSPTHLQKGHPAAHLGYCLASGQDGAGTRSEGIELRLMLLNEENCRQEELESTLEDSLASQRLRSVNHDGHFQRVGDCHSRDSLVVKYRQLFHDSDFLSQRLENIFPEHASHVEEQSSEYFLVMLKAAFRSAAELFAHFQQAVAQVIKLSLHGNSLTFSSESHSGAVNLTREWVRENSAIYPQETLVNRIVQEAKETNLHNLLVNTTTAHQSSSIQEDYEKVLQDCATTYAELAWHFQVLPTPLTVLSTGHGNGFDQSAFKRHSSSDPKSQRVTEMMWPALVSELDQTVVLEKGIVVT